VGPDPSFPPGGVAVTAPAAAVRPGVGESALVRAVGEWRQIAGRQEELAREYAAAVAAESAALIEAASVSASGAPPAEVGHARTALAHAMGVREEAGRRLRLPAGLPVPAARAAEDVLTAARVARARGAA
jgi:hypothetical protein